MRKMKSNTLKGAAAVALAAVLAGCQMMGPPPQQRAAIQPQPQQRAAIDGEWMTSDGIATFRFRGGQFQGYANDTGSTLSEGSYLSQDGRSYALSGTSLIRQAPIRLNCQLVTSSQLNCTSAEGAQSSLVRRA